MKKTLLILAHGSKAESTTEVIYAGIFYWKGRRANYVHFRLYKESEGNRKKKF